MLSILKASIETLTVSEQRVAEICLQNPLAFASMPVGMIADLAHVSKPTVIRFCRNVGYLGLADFKRKLLTNSRQGTPFIHPKVDSKDSAEIVRLKLIDSTIESMLNLRHRPNDAKIEAAVRTLAEVYKKSGRVQVFGVGYSSLVAQDFCYRLSTIGIQATHFVDAHMQLAAASTLSSCDCAVIYSASGRTKDMLEIAKRLRERESPILAVTLSNSPLAALVDVHLAADHEEARNEFNPMTSRLLQLMTSDILVTTAALSIDCKTFQKKLEAIQSNLNSRRV